MIIGHPIAELLWLAAAIAVAGVATGIFAGLFGIGGGAIIVPVLFEVFRILEVPEAVRMQLCVGTSLAIIVPTAIRSYLAHRAKGYVISEVTRAWAAPAVLGVAAGSLVAAYAPAGVSKIAFVVVACIVATKLLAGRASWVLAAQLPGRALMRLYGFIIGLASSLMGVSGGSLSNMVMTLYAQPIHRAVGTSAALGVPITIAGTIGYVLAGLPYQAQLPPLSVGFVSLVGVALMAPISSFVAPIGARLAHRLPKRQLEVALGVFLLLVAARFLVSLIG
jgi:uncharacterized protein